MTKDDGQSGQLNLTVVALVALVAIVGLVALVLNTTSLAGVQTRAAISYGSAPVAASDVPEQNVVGDLKKRPERILR